MERERLRRGEEMRMRAHEPLEHNIMMPARIEKTELLFWRRFVNVFLVVLGNRNRAKSARLSLGRTMMVRY